MKKFLSIGFLIVSSLYGEPYKPAPILWIHGFTGSSKDWGVKMHKLPVDPRPDTIIKDSVILDHTFGTFLNKILPYCIVWDSLEDSYTIPNDTSRDEPWEGFYPNKSFLEVINFDYPVGSVDPDIGLNFWERILPFSIFWITSYIIDLARGLPMPKPREILFGWGTELRQRIKQVLNEYYGDNWQNNPDAKVILIAHSIGGLAIRQENYV